MNNINKIFNIPQTLEPLVIIKMYIKKLIHSAIYIVNQETQLHNLASIFKFYVPNLEIIIFPAWNSIPYKKNSPHNSVMAERIKTLYSLITRHNDNPYIIISTINAITQKVLHQNIILQSVLKITSLQNITKNHIEDYLTNHGYSQYSIVQDIGEFATYNNIIDIFPTTYKNPIRIHLNNNLIQSIHYFNRQTQLIDNNSSLNEVVIYPTSEIIKQKKNIDIFSKTYKTKPNQDQNLLNTIISGKKHIGEENFLPLFYKEELQNIFNYISQNTTLIFNDKLINEIKEYNNQIYLNYRSQLSYQVPPPQLYVDSEEFKIITKQFHKTIFSQSDNTSNNSAYTDRNIHTSSFNITEKIQNVPNFKTLVQNKQIDIFEILTQYIKTTCHTKKLIIACYSTGSLEYIQNRLRTLNIKLCKIENYQEICSSYNIAILPIYHSFISKYTIVIAEHDLLYKQETTNKSNISNIISNDTNLDIGDIVIHKDYGIGKIVALETTKVFDSYHDFIKIEYYNNDKLFLPVENINLISKYGQQNVNVTLDKLGSTSWQQRKTKIKNHIKKIAKELLTIEAARRLSTGKSFFPDENYKHFCNEFSYTETEDQLQAIKDMEHDLSSGKIMNRLICGDVGFGKTEIALRAAFLVASQNYQVAIIVPTTLLCRQHFIVFTERFKKFPNIKIKQLSKIVARSEIKKTKESLSCGQVHIIIGTHAILAQDVTFANLSLLIIDEEQQFGVKQKELLKKIKTNVHVISLSATPIPRTLYMSLCGIKDLSLIKTPPKNRLAVTTYTTYYEETIIKDAIIREHNRGGRVFYVCPQISNIKSISDKIRKLVPEIKMNTAHGQLSPTQLDTIMNDFFDGKFTILLTTSIIECGLDIPFANTIIIHNADMFGLAQLYQLKGRVGRSSTKGFAYFILSEKATNKSAIKLEIIQSIDSINSGFNLSLHDMDIRGFGNLVGEEQSGNIKDIGIELYQQMLEEELNIYSEYPKDLDHINININVNIRIPEHYIQDIGLRMRVYKKIGSLKTKEDIDNYYIELTNKFGKLPNEVENLLNTIYIKQLCANIGIYEVEQIKNSILLKIDSNTTLKQKILNYFINNPLTFKIQNNSILMLINNSSNCIISFIIHHISKINLLNKKAIL
ncbi:transcription-repair coupling factor [Ehrlichia chaffeensis str. Heartland]|uniref:Transcription-repair-coupling factor n=1 Tax=Ehrlichia chaffeensis (strain ATCC CRL-10679 / Arkansas) TaxID=205920 RepID=Q2GHL2_EHRCR|nr:transcription-repair coupling factor [Ehrlichia chaffeensis]ABD45115.1 transcription-repair coupling factor [Ehrlichia chaffeensis str. Arkansas]AHX03375.1 transcription-repair coupling factor [Ehrlichia chaffeensis str. Heartland]AHX06896.1 transcription-repair coupling factor [Ehrlichia chaffeensis str. Liberty]AHX08945.1 transcription-repair coupling factor [Ehrlichia chaffeensis str. Saint Vincent]AHX09768.1 transcription-repair coupling factor [Ehrlichia chaffeensis str. Wakulla]